MSRGVFAPAPVRNLKGTAAQRSACWNGKNRNNPPENALPRTQPLTLHACQIQTTRFRRKKTDHEICRDAEAACGPRGVAEKQPRHCRKAYLEKGSAKEASRFGGIVFSHAGYGQQAHSLEE
jgi:hypothetical protein